MPEFILDHGSRESAIRYRDLDGFTQGYIEAMFFTETGTGDDGDMKHATLADLAPDTWSAIEADCAQFLAFLDPATTEAIEDQQEEAGRDFWYTRNGHGVGFWETDRWPEPIGAVLDNAAKAMGEVWLYRGDDGLLYF